MANIFSPIQLKNIAFKNRIVMAAMIRFGFPGQNGMMSEELVQKYLYRADQDIGLLISQALSPVPQTIGDYQMVGVYSEDHIGFLSRIADKCHENGNRFFAQLGLAADDINTFTTEELESMRDKFIYAAKLCKKAGLDGVEIHGAHEAFLNKMSSAVTNQRSDKYGGNLENRLTFAKELIEGVNVFSDDTFLASYRMGLCTNLDEDIETASLLENIGIEMIHISYGISPSRSIELPMDYDYSDIAFIAGQIKQKVKIPIIAVGGMNTLARGNRLIEADGCDFVAYGRPFLADGAFVKNSVDDMDYKPCYGCRACQWYTNGEKCPAQSHAKTNS